MSPSIPEHDVKAHESRHGGGTQPQRHGATMNRTVHAHSTPEPDEAPPKPTPVPEDVPSPANAPVEEPRAPQPPIRA